jgi:hypothetical protein
MAFVPLHLLRTQSTVQQTVTMSVPADLTVQDVNVVLMDVEEVVELVPLAAHAQVPENVSVTETVLERNVEMTVVTPEIFVTSVVLLKSVELTSDALELVPPTAVTATEHNEFVVTMDVSVLVENVLPFQDKISDAETDNVSAVLNVTISNAVLMDAEEIVEPVQVMPLALTDLVSTQFWDAAVMVFANPL